MSLPLPRQPVPALAVPTLAHGPFTLADERPERFTLVVFYRGLHCPICLKYLLELGRLLPEFAKRGVGVLALSSDTRERAQAMADKLRAPDLRLGYTLPLPMARDWGLFVSTSRGTTSLGIDEPAYGVSQSLEVVWLISEVHVKTPSVGTDSHWGRPCNSASYFSKCIS